MQENKPRGVAALMEKFDPSHGDDDAIYSPDAEFSSARFERGWRAPASPHGRGSTPAPCSSTATPSD